jgi:hypothetical protein
MKALELTDGMDSEPTSHLHLPQHLKSAACGESLTGLNDAVQSLLVTLLFLGGIKTQTVCRDQTERTARPDTLGKECF